MRARPRPPRPRLRYRSRHLLITGPPGSGKTELAVAIAKAAAKSGRSSGAALVTPSGRWSARDTVGRVQRPQGGPASFERGHVLAAAEKNRWLIVDELDRAELDRALGGLSSFLGGLPLALPDGSGEATAPKDWRLVATHGGSGDPSTSRRACIEMCEVTHLDASLGICERPSTWPTTLPQRLRSTAAHARPD